MIITAAAQRRVVGGVDTHADTRGAAAVDGVGWFLESRQFPADAAGYDDLVGWLAGFGAPSLATGQGWLYLCVVRDGCSRRFLGYAFSDSLHTDPVETALRRAVTPRDRATGPTTGVIFHADRGSQYTSAQLAAAADQLGVRQSVGRTGVCWDNTQQESFWSTLKTEYYDRRTFTTGATAITAVSRWIDTVYNTRRRHSALGQFSPIQFESHITTATQAA